MRGKHPARRLGEGAPGQAPGERGSAWERERQAKEAEAKEAEQQPVAPMVK